MSSVTIEEAQAKLPELIEHLAPGEEVVITAAGLPVAHMKRAEHTSWPCEAGTAKDQILWISPDFDAPLEGFEEYME